MSQLKIYSASAGSGKTYQLTRHYLDLLFRDPENYRKILAVTFTNKAAGELKNRVIEELVGISSGNTSGSGHLEYLTGVFKSEERVRSTARRILRKILQDYSHFGIGTIDHFFQQVLRSFGREAGLHTGYKLELNSGLFLQGAVDLMMSELDHDPKLLDWLGRWVDYKITNEENWSRIEQELMAIGGEFLKEKLMGILADNEKDKYTEESIAEFDSLTKSVIKTFETELAGISEKARDIIGLHNLEVKDFIRGDNGPAGFLANLSPAKLQNKRHENAVDNPGEWHKKDIKEYLRQKILSAVEGGLNSLLKEAHDLLREKEAVYNSALAIRQFLFSLGITGKLMDYLNRYSEQNNSLLINLTAPLLSEIIGNNPSPFIYEKVGTYYDHFMIDEFQDTSVLQWSNFLPLIKNSLSEDDFSMVVGDVKQSIFRWRNSNWRLMAESAEKDVEDFGVEKIRLEKNYRSREYIIDFNNDIFASASKVLVERLKGEFSVDSFSSGLSPDIIGGIYGDAEQEKGQKKPGGYVEIRFQDDGGDESADWDSAIPELVEDLQVKHGYKPEDIVFLVRTNKQAREVSNLFQKYQQDNIPGGNCSFNLVSSESYELQNSASIRCIIQAIRYIIEPNDTYVSARLAQEYASLRKRQPSDSDFANILNLKGGQDQVQAAIWELIPRGFIEKRDLYRYASCTRVIEEIIRIFGLYNDPKELPYLMALRDHAIAGFGIKNGLEELSDWWDIQGRELKVPMTDQSGSMSVMTIHKAKGLEFKVVIIPFCDWELGKVNPKQMLWVETKGTVFSRVPLVPVKFVKLLERSVFAQAYYDEKLQVYLDNLNLLYVAFTRAVDRLYAFCPAKSRNAGYSVKALLTECLSKSLLNGQSSPEIFSFGNPVTAPDYGKKAKAGREVKPFELVPFPAEPYSGLEGLRDDFDSEAIKHGRIMHEILEMTETVPDLEPAVNSMVERGVLPVEKAGILKARLGSLLMDPVISDWFSGRYKVHRERGILVPGRGELRPDRLMEGNGEMIILEYKFGEPLSSHSRQVKGYRDALRDMGHINVRAFLLYPETGSLQEIA